MYTFFFNSVYSFRKMNNFLLFCRNALYCVVYYLQWIREMFAVQQGTSCIKRNSNKRRKESNFRLIFCMHFCIVTRRGRRTVFKPAAYVITTQHTYACIERLAMPFSPHLFFATKCRNKRQKIILNSPFFVYFTFNSPVLLFLLK